MGHPQKRSRPRKTIPSFDFQTNRLRGVPKDSPEERERKDKMIEAFLKKRKARQK